MKSPTNILWIIALAIVGAMLLGRLTRGATPVPTVFQNTVSLTEALDRSQETGAPVLALATADWCGPCQHLKETTLVDTRVSDWIRANTIPVYIEESERPTDLRMLPVRAYPTSFVIADGQVVGKLEGGRNAEGYLRWLKETSERLNGAAPATPDP